MNDKPLGSVMSSERASLLSKRPHLSEDCSLAQVKKVCALSHSSGQLSPQQQSSRTSELFMFLKRPALPPLNLVLSILLALNTYSLATTICRMSRTAIIWPLRAIVISYHFFSNPHRILSTTCSDLSPRIPETPSLNSPGL